MDIQSHKGAYSAKFRIGALAALKDELQPDMHIVMDRRIAELYRDDLGPVLDHPSLLLLDASEETKMLEKFPAYVEHLVARKIRRNHLLVAIGGGVIQDTVCFLAATLLRGVPWRFYPTTLLAQADSCIGSKSSINCGDAKNILGTFTPPNEIFIDVSLLDTLDERDVRSGIGEMLKVHAIDGPEAFDRIAASYEDILADKQAMQRFVRHALEIKKGYIEIDEFDRGPRNIFNYGHSFGHAIEAATDFAIPHGLAVTIGMDMANFVSAGKGFTPRATFERMHPVLRRNYRGYEDHDIPLDRMLAAIAKDKKNIGDSLVLILPDADAKLQRREVANDGEFRDLCAEYLAGKRAS
jgi:3-dehydroquinate synthase